MREEMLLVFDSCLTDASRIETMEIVSRSVVTQISSLFTYLYIYIRVKSSETYNREGRHVWLQHLMYMKRSTLRRKKLDERSSRLSFEFYQCCLRHWRKLNQCNSSGHQEFYIHKTHQHYRPQNPLTFFHFLEMNRLSFAIGHNTIFRAVKFISPLCTVLITHTHESYQESRIQCKESNIISK